MRDVWTPWFLSWSCLEHFVWRSPPQPISGGPVQEVNRRFPYLRPKGFWEVCAFPHCADFLLEHPASSANTGKDWRWIFKCGLAGIDLVRPRLMLGYGNVIVKLGVQWVWVTEVVSVTTVFV